MEALISIGSRVRANGLLAADVHSDWDFQIITDKLDRFNDAEWLHTVGAGRPLAYVIRKGRLGSAAKVSLALPESEVDLVIIPARRLRVAKLLMRFGLMRLNNSLKEALTDLALVVRPGYRVEKGESAWGNFFRYIIANFPAPRLTDGQIRSLAEGFVCDYISARRKIDRGELAAAQRWLHHQLAETNFRLLHELRQRRGELSLPDARRLEWLADPLLVDMVTVRALPAPQSIQLATERASETCRELVHALIGDTWRWPLTPPMPAH